MIDRTDRQAQGLNYNYDLTEPERQIGRNQKPEYILEDLFLPPVLIPMFLEWYQKATTS